MGHKLHLVQTDAMLARAGAVGINRLSHKRVIDSFRLSPFGWAIGVKQHQHMKITIAHMPHDRARKTRLRQLLRCQINAFGQAR